MKTAPQDHTGLAGLFLRVSELYFVERDRHFAIL